MPLDIGTQILQKTCISPAPSSFAASIIAFGMRRMNLVRIKTAKGEKMPGKMIAHRVS